MENNLLTSLRKYRPRESNTPIENFITEAFLWLLKNYENFSEYYLNYLSEKLEFGVSLKNAKWETQVNFNGYFPDLVCDLGDTGLIFEHKIRAHLHENQLNNYRDYASKKYANYKLILITMNTTQHFQEPDLALCWEQIHKLITDWPPIKQNEFFLFQNFINLLEYEGLGPKAPISHESISYYFYANDFTKKVETLILSISNDKYIQEEFKQLIGEDFKLNYQNSWGRIGFQFLETWRPSIFAGVMVDWKDHNIKPILNKDSPDFVILLSFAEDLHGRYKVDENYINLVNELKQNLENNNSDWEFYNHLEDRSVEKPNNIWHPLYIRKPLIELLRGTKTFEEQKLRVFEGIKEVLPYFSQSIYFLNLRKEFHLP